MKITSCYICGTECQDWEDPIYWANTCLACCNEIRKEAKVCLDTGTDPKVGDVFPAGSSNPVYQHWVKAIAVVQQRRVQQRRMSQSNQGALTQKGMTCARCHDFNEFAVSNQVNGTFICYACRTRINQ